MVVDFCNFFVSIEVDFKLYYLDVYVDGDIDFNLIYMIGEWFDIVGFYDYDEFDVVVDVYLIEVGGEVIVKVFFLIKNWWNGQWL